MILGKFFCFLAVSNNLSYFCKKIQVLVPGQDSVVGNPSIEETILFMLCILTCKQVPYMPFAGQNTQHACKTNISKYFCLKSRHVLSSSNQSMPLFKNYSDLSDTLSFIQNKTFQYKTNFTQNNSMLARPNGTQVL